MKRKLLLLAAVGGFFSITLSSYNSGLTSGYPGGGNHTGVPTAIGNKTCGSGGGCHSLQPGSATLQLWDATTGNVVISPFSFRTDHSYRVLMTFNPTAGDNTSGTSRSFGFQLSSYVKSAGSVVSAPGGGSGDFSSPSTGSALGNAPSSSFYAPYIANGCSMVEQATKIQSMYTKGVFHDSAWVAWFPSDTASTGQLIDSVTFYCVFVMTDTSNYNLVPGIGVPNNGLDIYGSGQSFTYHRHTLDVAKVFNNVTITAYPNPTTSDLHIAMNGAQTGNYTVNVYDLSGRIISTQIVNVNSSVYTFYLNSGNWPTGMYQVQLLKDDASHTMSVIKQ